MSDSVFDRDKRIRSAQLTMPQTFYLVTLNQFVGKNPDAWPSQQTIASAMNATKRAVQKWQTEVDAEQKRGMLREQAVSAVSREMKRLAMELKIPVLVLSQLNREVEKRNDKRPMLSDLRESGAIEQDANVVLMLHRPDAYDAEDRPGVAEVIVSKNRTGTTGIVQLIFRKEWCRFETMPEVILDFVFASDGEVTR